MITDSKKDRSSSAMSLGDHLDELRFRVILAFRQLHITSCSIGLTSRYVFPVVFILIEFLSF